MSRILAALRDDQIAEQPASLGNTTASARVILSDLVCGGGIGDAILDSRVHSLDPPTIVTVPPGLNHGFRFSRDIEGLVITVISSHLGPALGRSRFGEWLTSPHVTRLMTIRQLGEEFEHRRSGRNELLAAYVTQALRLTLNRPGFAGDRLV